ncbi:MAG TPA: glycosyltransferase family 87 protein [Tepidisphaeraceae bacterium]
MQIFRPDPMHPIRKRLWQATAALALVMSVLVVREAVVRNMDGSHRLSLGEDFLPVYAAGRLVREGRSAELYAMDPLARIERQVVAEADLEPLPIYGPFLNPPFFAALYAAFAALPYRPALCVWLGFNLLLIAGSAALLCRMMPRKVGPLTWGLIPLLLVLPLPFWEAMCHQQNTFLSLFILCGVVTLWRGRGTRRCARAYGRTPLHAEGTRRVPLHDVLCGGLAGLLFYKPQLALAVAIVLVLTRGWRAMLGLAITGSLLLLFTLWQMPGTLTAFLHSLPPTIHWMRTALPYNWGRQVTPQSFWRLVIQGHVIGETNALPKTLAIATALGFAGMLAIAVIRYLRWGSDRAQSLDRLIAATIAAMPLMMPYYMDYDLTLLAIPAVLLAAEWVRTPATITQSDRWLFAAWIALFLEFYGNPGLGTHARLNLAVPLIGIVAGLSISRCLRREVATEAVDRYDAPELSAAA